MGGGGIFLKLVIKTKDLIDIKAFLGQQGTFEVGSEPGTLNRVVALALLVCVWAEQIRGPLFRSGGHWGVTGKGASWVPEKKYMYRQRWVQILWSLKLIQFREIS